MSPNLAKRLDCGVFTAAFGRARRLTKQSKFFSGQFMRFPQMQKSWHLFVSPFVLFNLETFS